MKTQKGFAHGVVVLGIVVLLIGALSFVFWSRYSQKKSAADITQLKIFTSISGSGLTFTYPASWSFDPPTQVVATRPGSETVSYILFSQPMHVVNGRPEVASDSMCVTLSEFKGDFPFRSTVPSGYVPLKKIMVGANKVSLMTPGGEAGSTDIRLASADPVSAHGAYYVSLKNDFYLVAYAQKNCYPTDNPTKRDISLDIQQARSILESIRLNE